MKKNLVFLLVFSILLGLLAGCAGEVADTSKKSESSNKKEDTGNKSCQHSFDENGWQIVQEATCQEQGYRERDCQNCTYTQREDLPLATHAYMDGECTICGDSVPASEGLQFSSDYYHAEWIGIFQGMGECTDTVVIVPAKIAMSDSEYPVHGIGAFAEFGTNVTEITFLSSIYDMPTYFFSDYETLKKVAFAEGQSTIPVGSFFGNSAIAEVVLPSTLTEIGKSAFSDCTALESVTIPAGVQRIQEKTFLGCTSLKNVSLSDGLLRIHERAFENCTALETIQLPATVTTIDSYAFSGCEALSAIAFPNELTSLGAFVCAGAKNLKSVTIGEKVTIIGICAFQNCFELEQIDIPASVTSIAKGAFSGCTKLSTITFAGTVEQWGQITKGDSWNNYCPATAVICSDGEVPLV